MASNVEGELNSLRTSEVSSVLQIPNETETQGPMNSVLTGETIIEHDRSSAPFLPEIYSHADTAYAPEYAKVEEIIETRPPSRIWVMELCAVVLSLTALAAAVVLLTYENGKPLNTWNGFFSLNTVVSILGVLSHTSLAFAVSSCVGQEKWNWFKEHPDQILTFRRFDEASRGPLGSIQLVWWLKLRHFASLGAITTVILLAFDPFLQAIIKYEGILDVVGQGVDIHIPGSLRLDAGIYRQDEGDSLFAYSLPDNSIISVLKFMWQPDMGMSAAVFNGFAGTSLIAKPGVAVACSTGNCTWPLFTSLAICSACNDISDRIAKIHENGDGREVKVGATSINGSFTKYVLPGLNFSNVDGQAYTAFSPDDTTTMVAQAINKHEETISFQGSLNLISAVVVMRAHDSYAAGTLRWENTPITATECALYLCTNLYNSSVVHGSLEETILGSWSRRNMDSYLPPSLSVNLSKAWAAEYNYSFVLPNGDLFREDLQLYMTEDDVSFYPTLNDKPLRFNVSQAAIASTVSWIQSFFTKNKLIYGVGHPAAGQPPVVQSLGASNNLTETFSNVSLSMTIWLRNSAGVPLPGTMQQWTIHIKVRWGFIALPCIAIIAGSLFALLTILETRRLQLPALKSDALATIAYGFNDKDRVELSLAAGSGDIDRTAKTMVLKFGKLEKGLNLLS